jgi:uncharacterized membrane protein|uniref:Uncharacterized protein n=1 Tax=Desulfobacca acetoxidans TaxID=60893 RepID=A0A7C3WQJ8_9BACT
MGKVCDKKRRMVLRQRQQRRAKLKKLKQAYLNAKTETDKARIIGKITRLAPYLPVQTYLSG